MYRMVGKQSIVTEIEEDRYTLIEQSVYLVLLNMVVTNSMGLAIQLAHDQSSYTVVQDVYNIQLRYTS